jgi:hypothetical protein
MQYVPKMLVNFRVQLGEQMQIHELTRPRKVNEGVLGAVGAALGGIAKQVGKQAINKAVGTDVTSQAGPAQSREQGFQDMANSSAAKTLATSMQTAWQQTVQNFMANSKDANGNPPTSIDQVTQPSIATLKANLQDLVNNMLGRNGANYKNIATFVTDPNMKDNAEDIIVDIDKSIDAIYNATLQNTDSKAVEKMFTQLVGMGILPAQNIMAYDTGRRGMGGAGATGAVQLSPEAQRLADQAKITDADVLNLQQLGKNPANHAALMQMMGIPSK